MIGKIINAFNKIGKLMETTTEKTTLKYVYTSEELKNSLTDAINSSYRELIQKGSPMYYSYNIRFITKKYEDSKFSEHENILYIGNLSNLINEYLEVFSKSSKNSKKKINKMIYLLSKYPNRRHLLVKILNFFEKISSNKRSYQVVNIKEQRISALRKEYKTVVKYIKMDLHEELKRTREAYKKEKGDFYKKR